MRKAIFAATAASLFAIPVSTALAQPSFDPGVDYFVGRYPEGIDAGDLNGDGHVDLVSVSWGSSTDVSVLIGDGDGTYARAVNYSSGSADRAVELGDMDGDHDLDIVVAGGFGFAVLLNDGTGAFGPASSISAGSSLVTSVALGDFDQDGTLDVALGTQGSLAATVTIFPNLGNGTFGSSFSISTLGTAYAVTAADVNNDGFMDVLYRNSNVTVRLGTGGGAFLSAMTAPGTANRSIEVADFNRDGIPDLLTANGTGGQAGVHIGNGDGTFQTPTNFTVGSDPTKAIAADVTNDWILDLIIVNRNSNDLTIYVGNGDGSFGAQTTIGVGNQPVWVVSDDLDDDSDADLALVNRSDGDVRVLLSNTPVREPVAIFVDDFSADTVGIEPIQDPPGLPTGDAVSVSTNPPTSIVVVETNFSSNPTQHVRLRRGAPSETWPNFEASPADCGSYATGQIRLTWRLAAEQTNTDGFFVIAPSDLGPIFTINYLSTGFLNYQTAASSMNAGPAYEVGVWQDFEVVLDMDTETYDLNVDGVPIADNVPFQNKGQDAFSLLRFAAGGDPQAYRIDDVRIASTNLGGGGLVDGDGDGVPVACDLDDGNAAVF